ncbi:aminoglycoside phosphotransferase family protein [Moraxella cuniculi]|uniref:Predicted phosphotransferase related to Ser/Thr protein kinases n=1 Tax=Moraxella cuniculi TaxID=34061 RepID=A0A3S4UL73_9GAMM|nr:phosphotransferase [Moraxella cuniculi]VEG13437.1 Predicted phosphotransferase related to Ser/Thr protein kinases [Moraxella cuniculi]
MSTLRKQQMMDFLHSHLAAGFRVESLAADASFRCYHRIHLPIIGEQGKHEMSYLLMDAPPDKEDIGQFIHVAELMSEAVNVPNIIAKDEKQGFLLLQDFGTVQFADAIASDADNKDRYYTLALSTLADLQKIDTDIDLSAYSDDKLREEMELFCQWFLPYLGVTLDSPAQQLWQTLTEKLIKDISSQPAVVVHRDYHSRNLMMDKGSDGLGVIDFQDALIGAYTYDLVSLVRDAYIDYDEQWVEKRIQEFYQLIRPAVDLGSFIGQTNIMGVQRHLKVLGIFIRLSQRDGKHRYLHDIPKVMRDLLTELNWLNTHSNEAVYGEFLTWINNQVLPAYQHKFINKSK